MYNNIRFVKNDEIIIIVCIGNATFTSKYKTYKSAMVILLMVMSRVARKHTRLSHWEFGPRPARHSYVYVYLIVYFQQ